MQRRTFLRGGLAAASMSAISTGALGQEGSAEATESGASVARFQLRYAPHFGMFRHHAGNDLIDQLKFMADEGFTALEDNGLPRRKDAEQERIGQALRDLGMTMGVFVAHANFDDATYASTDAEDWKRIEVELRRAVEVAKRVDAQWCTIVPGAFHRKHAIEFQTATVVDNLRRTADIFEPEGLIAVLEPLNPYKDHPGCFLSRIPQAFALCRAVDRPSVKILNDLYHQQITEGNLIPNMDRAWSEIAYFQVGDNPGRKEPTTGEINFLNVFKHLHAKGFEGIVGMEHGNSRGGKEGERAVIDAYRAVDRFA